MARQMKDSGIEWIGEIPETWDTIKFKYLFSITGGNGFPENLQGQTEGTYPFCKVSDINGHSDYVDTAANYVSDEVAKAHGFNIIPCGSIIIAKIGAALQKNHRKINSVPCCIDNNTQALVPIRADNLRYLLYLTRCIDMGWFDNNSTVPSLNNNKLLNFFVPNVSVAEQQRIATFLDHKCAEIDAVIERTKATIEEYKKLKQAVITEAVTKGVRGPRPMKDSGIEWIGEIPEGWATVQLKRLARIATGSTPPKNEESTFYSQDSGCLWIKAEDLGTSNNIETTTEYLTEAGKREGRIFPPCTVYVCCIASVGKVGYCVTEASCNQQINGLIFENAHWKYGFYLSLAQEEEYLLNASGNVMKILNTDKQSRLMCPCPPVEEQVEIATFLDGKCAALDTIIAKKTALLTELETYKKSLIYEYVTGKKEVN